MRPLRIRQGSTRHSKQQYASMAAAPIEFYVYASVTHGV